MAGCDASFVSIDDNHSDDTDSENDVGNDGSEFVEDSCDDGSELVDNTCIDGSELADDACDDVDDVDVVLGGIKDSYASNDPSDGPNKDELMEDHSDESKDDDD